LLGNSAAAFVVAAFVFIIAFAVVASEAAAAKAAAAKAAAELPSKLFLTFLNFSKIPPLVTRPNQKLIRNIPLVLPSHRRRRWHFGAGLERVIIPCAIP